MWSKGSQTIGDSELLEILVGTGVTGVVARALAATMVEELGGVIGISRASPREIAQVRGVGAARATRIAAAFELGRRALVVDAPRESLGRAADVARVLAPRLAGIQQELFFVVGIDVRNHLLDVVEVARGSVSSVEVHPREVFRPLIRMAAAAGVLVHNHPTGDPTPSLDDLRLTERMKNVGDTIGVPIIDHVVIAGDSFVSIGEWTEVPS